MRVLSSNCFVARLYSLFAAARRVWIIRLRAAIVFGMLEMPWRAHAVEYVNPIGVRSFSDLVITIARAVTAIGIPLATIAIVFVGVRFTIAAASGNPGKVQEARKLLWYVLIGTVVIVGAAYLAEAVVNFVRGGFRG